MNCCTRASGPPTTTLDAYACRVAAVPRLRKQSVSMHQFNRSLRRWLGRELLHASGAWGDSGLCGVRSPGAGGRERGHRQQQPLLWFGGFWWGPAEARTGPEWLMFSGGDRDAPGVATDLIILFLLRELALHTAKTPLPKTTSTADDPTTH